MVVSCYKSHVYSFPSSISLLQLITYTYHLEKKTKCTTIASHNREKWQTLALKTHNKGKKKDLKYEFLNMIFFLLVYSRIINIVGSREITDKIIRIIAITLKFIHRTVFQNIVRWRTKIYALSLPTASPTVGLEIQVAISVSSPLLSGSLRQQHRAVASLLFL